MNPAEVLAAHRWSVVFDGCACGDPTIDRGRHPAHVLAALTNAGHVLVRRPDAKNPTPALIEAAHIVKDDGSMAPPWAIDRAARAINSFIAAAAAEAGGSDV